MKGTRCTDAEVDALLAALGQCNRGQSDTWQRISEILGRPMTRQTAECILQRRNLGRPTDWMRGGTRHVVRPEAYSMQPSELLEDDDSPTLPRPFPERVSVDAPAAEPAQLRRLVDLCQKRPMSFEDTCDAMELPPSACRRLFEQARAAGYALRVESDALHWRTEDPREDVQETGAAPVVGERHSVAVISDLHFGSKWHGTRQLIDFLEIVRERGIKHVLGPGDNLDGVYKHSMWEQSRRGFDEQCDHFFETWRMFPDLMLHTIDGNHDDTLSESCGMQSGRAVMERFRSYGLNNLRFYGSRSARLSVYGAQIHLWHPRGSGSYALSYKAQKKVESYAPGHKPDILLTGHYHQHCKIAERGVHAFLCPTFQLPGGSFSNSLTGSPSVGGMILDWMVTADGTLRCFRDELVSYYSGERVEEVA